MCLNTRSNAKLDELVFPILFLVIFLYVSLCFVQIYLSCLCIYYIFMDGFFAECTNNIENCTFTENILCKKRKQSKNNHGFNSL